MPTENLRIACLQMDLAWLEPETNLQTASRLLAQLSQPADVVILPEMFSTGFTTRDMSRAETEQGPVVQWMQAQAKKQDCLFGGSLLISEDGHYVNRFVWVSAKGSWAGMTNGIYFRSRARIRFQAGSRQEVMFWRGWRIMPLICYDLRFPVWSRNKVESDGKAAYDLLVYVASWPEARIHHWDALLKARAIENQAFVVGVNRIGTDGNGFSYNGHSQVVNAQGEVTLAPAGEACLLESTLSAEDMAAYRQRFPFWREADNFGWT